MMEFVLTLPLLCLLIFAAMFFRHIQDYQMDAGHRIRTLFWEKTVPFGDLGCPVSSEQGAVRLSALSAPFVAGGFSEIAAERYFGPTPYGRIGLPLNNYVVEYPAPAPMTRNIWLPFVTGFASYFEKDWRGRDGGPEGSDAVWMERFPMVVDPWQRDFAGFKSLATMENPIARRAGFTLSILTPTGRIQVNKADDVEDGETRQNAVVEIRDAETIAAIMQ